MESKNSQSEYRRIKKLLGHQPSSREFFSNSKFTIRSLGREFGRNAFLKLTELCGDIPNAFLHPKSNLNEIFQQYGGLIRRLGKLPAAIEWDNAKLKPMVDGIRRSHNIKWVEMPIKFLEYANKKNEWIDIKSLISTNLSVENNPKIIQSKGCSVYLMFNIKTKSYKIGMANKVEYREKTLQSEEPSIKLLAFKKFVNRRMAANFEKALHQTYMHKRYRGEWFYLNEGDVAEIKETLDDKME